MRKLLSAVSAISLLLFQPNHFIERATREDIQLNLQRNEELRRQHPDGVLTPEEEDEVRKRVRWRTATIRRALRGGIFSVAVTIALAWLSGFAAHGLLGPAPRWLIWALQISAAAILLGATLSLLGWEIQSFSGETLPEKVNRWTFRALYILGTYLLIVSMVWSPDSGTSPIASGQGARWLQILSETTHLWEMGTTLIGTFVGVFLAFWLDRRQQEAQAMRRYANTLNSVRADLANLWAISRLVSDSLARSEGVQSLLPLESPALDAALINPAVYDRIPYGLVTCLIFLANLRRAVQNALHQNRPAPSSDNAGLRQQVDQLIRVISYVQTVLDEEAKPLGKPVIRTPHDVQVIDGLKRARRGENAQGTSDRS